MGTDIHMCVEKRKEDGSWERITKMGYQDWDRDKKYLTDTMAYSDRNYDVFAILADVRNGHGFAGTDTGDGFVPISAPRGLPDDMSESTAEFCADSDHSESWLGLRELVKFNWERVSVHRGFLSEGEYLNWREGARTGPQSYSGGVSGQGVRCVTEKEYLANGRPANAEQVYVQVSWEERYWESAYTFYSEFLPKLVELAEGDLDSVRIVFWFDS